MIFAAEAATVETPDNLIVVTSSVLVKNIVLQSLRDYKVISKRLQGRLFSVAFPTLYGPEERS